MLLHISSYYIGSVVYANLISELDKEGLVQTVYVPVRSDNHIDRNSIQFTNTCSKIIYRRKLSILTRLNYKQKIDVCFNDLVKCVDISKYHFLHAHTWFSDGGIAYRLFKERGTPYAVTIRNTDINIFLRYFFHLRPFARRILLNSSKIILISKCYKERLLNHPSIRRIAHLLEPKCQVIPNGIDKEWHTSLFNNRQQASRPFKLLFVGRFDRNKNVLRLLDAVRVLNKQNYSVQLHLVGENKGAHAKTVSRIVSKNSCLFKYHGAIREISKLRDLYRSVDLFVMPSITETFGLVYIEALSQGTPVVWSENEGITGLFSEPVGETVQPKSVKSIASGIEKIIHNYENYNFNPEKIVSDFSWSKIAAIHKSVYLDSLRSKYFSQ